MTAKPVVLLPQAGRDIQQALQHYGHEGGEPIALKWVAAIETALRHVGAHPRAGSVRYATVLMLAGLRFWPVKAFPYLLFYVEREAQVDVWRVLHGQRDMPGWLRATGSMNAPGR